MSRDTPSSKIKPPKRLWELLTQYLALITRFVQQSDEIEEKARTKITLYLKEQGADTKTRLIGANELLRYIDEFVDVLLIYYAYYRNEQRALATLYAAIGITDHRMFAEMVRVASDPRIKVKLRELDVQGIRWFLNQFLNDYEAVERHKERLIHYFPKLKEATSHTYIGAMQRFLEVLQYVASAEASELREKGLEMVSAAIEEEQLDRKVTLVIDAIDTFTANARNHPTFVLTESSGYFGTAELEEFDIKINTFEKLREMFKEHVSISARTEWVYRRHHTTLLASIFEGSHLELVDLRDKIRAGSNINNFVSAVRDCQGMLLGVSQAHSLYLEYSAYQQQMLTLVDAYRQIAEFLQSELLKIFYEKEVKRNQLYLEVRDSYQQILDEFQQTLLEVCSLESSPE